MAITTDPYTYYITINRQAKTGYLYLTDGNNIVHQVFVSFDEAHDRWTINLSDANAPVPVDRLIRVDDDLVDKCVAAGNDSYEWYKIYRKNATSRPQIKPKAKRQSAYVYYLCRRQTADYTYDDLLRYRPDRSTVELFNNKYTAWSLSGIKAVRGKLPEGLDVQQIDKKLAKWYTSKPSSKQD